MDEIILEKRQGNSILKSNLSLNTKKLYIESYGCQMNFADSEIVASILNDDGYKITDVLEEASLVLVNTCAIQKQIEIILKS